jgi:pimeloyl-ACP methyl ester carboxylesterase
MRICTARGRRR